MIIKIIINNLLKKLILSLLMLNQKILKVENYYQERSKSLKTLKIRKNNAFFRINSLDKVS
jgi:hypothetical protein